MVSTFQLKTTQMSYFLKLFFEKWLLSYQSHWTTYDLNKTYMRRRLSIKLSGQSEQAQEMNSRVSPMKGHPRFPKGSWIMLDLLYNIDDDGFTLRLMMNFLWKIMINADIKKRIGTVANKLQRVILSIWEFFFLMFARSWLMILTMVL